ncbi:ABC transporter substrate-binding protein [Bordetella pseudohinzii]|uniref:ABC transporter substrate-binding protein n=1 Tax=Bordetella pseudohinzii TaxID=1331258 RepID=A0A0J6C553_9BORD|nr:ABC transporter substrate-binding protein [Bordetella pseudohinzii]ANY15179.1 ABC transporter substrate-binding protein [Bordetella pseudohinzii]KMM26228.1 ABC transporter substrate-binding protein [Bordetella pseudohinzii]KXA75690.1 ABC transporter substrate-binding protein [Bordetella pseudohinzii]KXA76147.1 ABC transporter substrate-binding protein [Bordetella pseudohinzii]CUI50946.1 Leucine-%2C isoleucine-%2C valine-%2C threonine-%2C and alanine-binding protein precursor [Bordetella pse
MKRILTRRLPAALACAVGVLAGSVRAEPAPIKIGAVVSATGPASFLGDPEQKTLQLYVDKLNAEGGVLGRKLALTLYDDASDANKANAFVRRLIMQDEVDLIVGGSTTGSTMAMVPQAQSAKIPFVSLAAASVIVEPVKPWVFKMPHSDRMAAAKVLEDMKKNGLTRMALLSDTGGFGKSGRTETLKLAQSMGVEVVDDQQYGERDTDMTPQLTRIKSSSAQAVFVFGTGQAPAIIARNYRQLAMKLPLYTSHGQASMEFVRLSGEAAEGIRMPSPALQVARSLPADDPQREVSVNYAEAFEGRYKVEVSTFGGYAHDGLLMVADAIRRAGGADRAKLRQALEDTKGFVGVSGIYTMTPEDHMGLDISAFRMVEVRKGAFQALP